MRKLFKALGIALAIFSVAQFSTVTAANGVYVQHYNLQSTSSATTVVTAKTSYVTSVVITVSTVGTNPIQITNTAGEVLFQAASTALGTIVTYNAGSKDTGILAVGLKVVGPATAVTHIAITYYTD